MMFVCIMFVFVCVQSGYTPLHLAARSGHENLVRLLLNSPGVQADVETDVHVRVLQHSRESLRADVTDVMRSCVPRAPLLFIWRLRADTRLWWVSCSAAPDLSCT